MRTPFVPESTLREMPPASAKVLILLCAESRGSRSVGCAVDSAASLGISRALWRSAIDWLVSAGIVRYSTSNRGYQAEIRHGSRFTWVPSYADDRLRRASPRACKALLAICRAISNQTRSIRMKCRTLADRLGRSLRTASLALRELRERQIIDTARTGRSSWFSVVFTDPQGQLFNARPVAHQPSLLLRILSTISRSELSSVLTHLSRRDPSASERARCVFVDPPASQRRFVINRLLRFGFDRLTAGALAATYWPDEINAVLSGCTDRTSPETIRRRLRSGIR